MSKLLILIVSAFFSTACSFPATGSQWQHPDDLNSIQLQRALSDCRMYLNAAQDSGMSPPHRQVHEWDDEFIRCMADRGWSQVLAH